MIELRYRIDLLVSGPAFRRAYCGSEILRLGRCSTAVTPYLLRSPHILDQYAMDPMDE